MTLKIGLTGNIGSGKTTVSEIFQLLGIPVYHADIASKTFLEDPAVKNEIVKYFGYGILSNDHEINRRSLASIVFADEQSLAKLNSILHPRVKQDFRNWVELNAGSPYVIHEAAIIFESGFSHEYDYIIDVSCPKEIAVKRVVTRDKIDPNSVLRRMQFQLEDAEKARLSDYVIHNDGSALVIPQVLVIHRHLLLIGPKNSRETMLME